MTYVSSSVNRVVERRAEALRKAQAGDRHAFNELITELTPMLWRVARGQGVDSASAEDVVQLAWLTFWRGLQDIKSPDALVGWLVTVTKREAVRVWRSGGREEPVEPDWDALVSEEPGVDEQVEEWVSDVSRHRVLWDAVASLTARCRQLMMVIANSERPDYDGIAQALNMPRGSIGPTRGRCLSKLRKMLINDPAWNERVELS